MRKIENKKSYETKTPWYIHHYFCKHPSSSSVTSTVDTSCHLKIAPPSCHLPGKRPLQLHLLRMFCKFHASKVAILGRDLESVSRVSVCPSPAYAEKSTSGNGFPISTNIKIKNVTMLSNARCDKMR